MRNQAKRLLSLGMGEIAAGMILVWVFLMLGTDWDLGTAGVSALSFLVFLLMQGGTYWLVRYRSLKNHAAIDPSLIMLFGGLRKLNRLLGVVILIAIAGFFENSADLTFAALLYLFALLEYVNYYEFRLSYGVSGFNVFELRRQGLRRSSLNRLLGSRRRL